MLKLLYGYLPYVPGDPEAAKDVLTNEEALHYRIRDTDQFRFGYWEYRLVQLVRGLTCCCSQFCTKKSNWYRRKVDAYKKYKVAIERLTSERDL